MSMMAAIKACFGKYVTFSGRARRAEYWWFFLFVMLCSLAATLIDSALFGVGTLEQPATQVVSPIVSLATFLPMLAVGWRRMHDTGRPGWYLLIPIFVSLLALAGLMLGVAGFSGLEQAGADPEALRTEAGELGIAGLAVSGIVQLLASVLVIWWLTRPTQPEDNVYGPVPK